MTGPPTFSQSLRGWREIIAGEPRFINKAGYIAAFILPWIALGSFIKVLIWG